MRLGVVRVEWSVRRGFCVDLACGWEKRAGLGRRSHLELELRLQLELNGVDLVFVERHRQGDDEW